MSNVTSSSRLAFKLALRDLRRFKGRSILAALLIFVPVLAMAGLLTFLRTVNVDGPKQNAQHLKGAAAAVQFASAAEHPEAFPAAGRVVGGTHGQPTTAQVAAQAHASVVRETEASLRVSPAAGGPQFTPTDSQIFIQTDLRSSIVRATASLDSGRWPTKPGEVVVTRRGLISGLPKSGTISISKSVDFGTDGANPTPSGTLTIVGSATSVTEAALLGPEAPRVASFSTTPQFLIAGSPWRTPTIQQWARYGAVVQTRSSDAGPHLGIVNTSGDKVIVAIGTMGFIAVTALLAGPAFAASATRQRRTLGLIAANGATRAVLRRIVLAQALLLGSLTAAVSVALGGVIGCLSAQWAHLHFEGTPAPADIPISWLVGVFIVSTVASLVAAAVPARSAGRTNLLAALRGQVSSRVVRKRWPLVGLVGVGLGTVCLLIATGPGDVNHDTRNVALSYIGIPLFFGGAILAVPYFLLLTGRLASRLPVTARIAVRDVSRQRTRATASVGAVLATTAVLSAASIFGASLDAFSKKHYTGEAPVGSGSLQSQSFGGLSEASAKPALESLPRVKALTTHATPLWITATPSGVPRLTAGACTPKSSNTDPWVGAGVIAINPSDISQAGFDAREAQVLNHGGAIVVTGHTTNGSPLNAAPLSARDITGGVLTLRDQNPQETAASITQRDCTSVRFKAIAKSQAPAHLQSLPQGSVVVTRNTLSAHHWPMRLWSVSLDPTSPMSKTTENRVAALTPPGMTLFVEHGYQSPFTAVLLGLTAGFALIVLLTTIVSTLLNDAESQADMATLAATGAPRGMRRRIVGAHAAAIGFIGAVGGLAVGFIPGLILARAATSERIGIRRADGGTYAVNWWPLLTMLVLVPLVAGLISMVFARRAPSLIRREA